MAWSGAARAAPAPACVEGTPEPSISPQLRPTQRAICGYDAAEFHRRLIALIGAREGTLGIETVERIFGLPQVTTAFDSIRHADYAMLVVAGGWSAMISVEESYGPDIASRPARFRGTLRPVRINPRARGEISIDVALLSPAQPGEPFCLTTAALAGAARRHGWGREVPSMAMDSGTVTMRLERGGLGLAYTPADCIDRVALDQPGRPPIVPITPAELEALRR